MARRELPLATPPGTTAGDILCWHRRQAGLTRAHIAAMDGRWTQDQVRELEDQVALAGSDIARYQRALRLLAEGGPDGAAAG